MVWNLILITLSVFLIAVTWIGVFLTGRPLKNKQ